MSDHDFIQRKVAEFKAKYPAPKKQAEVTPAAPAKVTAKSASKKCQQK